MKTRVKKHQNVSEKTLKIKRKRFDSSKKNSESLHDAIHRLDVVKKIFEQAIIDPREVMGKIADNEIKIPEGYKSLVYRELNMVSNREKKLSTVDETHSWLLTMLKHEATHQPKIIENYFSYKHYLKNNKPNTTVFHTLSSVIEYGIILEKFIVQHKWRLVFQRVKKDVKTLLEDEFNISDSYARKIRWIAKYGIKYERLKCLKVSLSALYNRHYEIDELFTSNLAHLWLKDEPMETDS